jgi:hypothetical protein
MWQISIRVALTYISKWVGKVISSASVRERVTKHLQMQKWYS